MCFKQYDTIKDKFFGIFVFSKIISKHIKPLHKQHIF